MPVKQGSELVIDGFHTIQSIRTSEAASQN
jgi:hypothetical protein